MAKYAVFLDDLPKSVIQDQQEICRALQNMVNHCFFNQIVQLEHMQEKLGRQRKIVIEDLQQRVNRFKTKQKVFLGQKKKLEKSMKSLDSYDRMKQVSKSDVNVLYNKSHIDEVDLKILATFEDTVAQQTTLDRLEQEAALLLSDFQGTYVL